MKLFKALLSELKKIFTDRNSVVMLFIAPVLLTFFIGGVYYNTYINDIPVVIYDKDDSSMSRRIVQLFEEDDRFRVSEYTDSQEGLKLALDNGRAMMGIYIPENFSKDIARSRQTGVLAFINGTNLVISNNAYAQAATIIRTVSASAVVKLLEAKGIQETKAISLAIPFDYQERMLYDPQQAYGNYLLFGFIAVFVQQMFLSGFGFSILKDRKRLAEGNPVAGLLPKFISCLLCLAVSIPVSVLIADRFFGVAVRGSIPAAFVLTVLFMAALSCQSILIACFTGDKVKYAQVCLMLSLPTFISAGYIWPLDQMPYPLVVVLKFLWPLNNFARPFDEVLFKGLPFTALKGNLLELLIYFAFWFPVSILLFRRMLLKKDEKCASIS